ncbi:MAG: hypothetical protein AABO58_18545 [Acidobacteriota bacterium]
MKHLFLAILLLAPATHAQWTPIGPPGGGVNAVRFAGERMYAAADGGVFASADRGATWTLLVKVAGWNASMLAVDARLPDNIVAVFAVASSGDVTFVPSRVFRSADGGATWHEATQNLPSEKWIRTLAVDPFNPSTLYLGLACRELSFKTGCDPCSAAASPAGVGIYKSIDGGERWTFSSGGLSGNDLCIRGVAPDPAVPNRIYSYSDTYQFTLFRRRSLSTNAGATWDVMSGDYGPSRDLVIHPRSGRRFAISDSDRSASIVISEDGGVWNPTSAAPFGPLINAFAVDSNDDAIIYAATNFGLARTTNRGSTWSKLTSSRQGVALSVAIDPADSRRIYLGANGGLFVSPDSGATWDEMEIGQVATAPHEVQFDPAHPGWLYALLSDDFAPQTVVRSRDNGRTWEPLRNGLEERFTSSAPSLAIAADGTPFSTMQRVTGNSPGIMRFDGSRWIEMPFPANTIPRTIVADPVDASTLYVATYSNIVFKTSDRGANWRAVYSTPLGYGSYRLFADRSGIYVFDSNIVKSEDRGETWRTLGTFFNQIFSLAVAGSTIYRIDCCSHALHRSDDGGATWKTLPEPPFDVRELAADPQRPNVVYARTRVNGLLRSVNSGLTWSAFNDNLPTLLLNGVAVDPRSGAVFALTLREGILVRPVVETRRRAIGH